MPHEDDSLVGSPAFPTTAWSQVARAQGAESTVAREALETLFERYWFPVWFFIKQKGKSREEAKDLTQGFFTTFLEKDAVSYAEKDRGKFRTFLLSSVCRYLAMQHRSASRRPAEVPLRGVLPDPDEWVGFEPQSDETPEDVFMHNWAKTFLESCVAALRAECEGAGKAVQFHVFEMRMLREKPLPTKIVAIELGIAATDVVNYLHRAKERFRRIAQEQMRDCVTGPGQVEEEIGGLLEMLDTSRG